jgi:hypothetical protein
MEIVGIPRYAHQRNDEATAVRPTPIVVCYVPSTFVSAASSSPLGRVDQEKNTLHGYSTLASVKEYRDAWIV